MVAPAAVAVLLARVSQSLVAEVRSVTGTATDASAMVPIARVQVVT